MSAKERIIERVPLMSDSDAVLILAFIDRICPQESEIPVSEKRKAFLELDEMINNMPPFPADFDYDKELAAALEEKYGRFD